MKSCMWCQEPMTQEYILGYCSQECFEAWFNHIEEEPDPDGEEADCENCGNTFIWETGYNDCCSLECHTLLFYEPDVDLEFTYHGMTLALEEDVAWEDQYG